MFRKTCIVLLSISLAAAITQSCRNRGIIPEDTMAKIYYDMYMTDQAVKENVRFRRMTDTLLIYEPIFNKYGYTSEDYTRSVNIYLVKPEKMERIFEDTRTMLDKREAQLKIILEAEGKRSRKWTILDSLEILTADGISSGRFYKTLRMMNFKPDTLVPMSPVPDTSFMERPQNPFMLFNDSAMNADSKFEFYKTLGYMEELHSLRRSRIPEKEQERLKEVVPRRNIRTQSLQVPDNNRRTRSVMTGAREKIKN